MPHEYNARRNLRLLGDVRVDLGDLDLEFPISPQDDAYGEQFKQQHSPGKTVAMYVLSQFEEKRWPAEKFAHTADRLAERGYTPLMVYGPGQEEMARETTRQMEAKAVVGYPMPTFPAVDGHPQAVRPVCGQRRRPPPPGGGGWPAHGVAVRHQPGRMDPARPPAPEVCRLAGGRVPVRVVRRVRGPALPRHPGRNRVGTNRAGAAE